MSDYSGKYENPHSILTNYINKINRIISNKFLGKLYTNKYRNWFDIENAYFQELIGIKNRFKNGYISGEAGDRMRQKELDSLNQLNKELIEIKNYLKEYLETIEIEKKNEIDLFFGNVFDIGRRKRHNYFYNIYTVNFNYTETIEKYFKNVTYNSLKKNYIHGGLKTNNLIFGYGNDQHKEYQEIKDLEINEFLENFKTFAYLNNNNYSSIYDEAIDGFDDYIVFVLGHSLGATDKTLLEEIFNNKKCKQIHLLS